MTLDHMTSNRINSSHSACVRTAPHGHRWRLGRFRAFRHRPHSRERSDGCRPCRKHSHNELNESRRSIVFVECSVARATERATSSPKHEGAETSKVIFGAAKLLPRFEHPSRIEIPRAKRHPMFQDRFQIGDDN